ncbi:MAG: hypothetical protein J5764_01850 [Bacteroidales bacterium]|nr:hypothetical protein [Bacteroidales bacterium]
MKKLILTIAVFLPALLAHSQEADGGSGFGTVSVIPRLEASPMFSTTGEGHNFSFPDILGTSSLYTTFEGDISEHFSFFICNHWLSTDPKSLYLDTFHSDSTNWLDFLYFTYKTGFFSLTAGKNVLLTGGEEYDPYDFDCHNQLLSSLWNNLPAYQWGLTASFDLPWEDNTISAQMATSPYSEKFFQEGLFVYSLGWNGCIAGCIYPKWTISLFQDTAEDRAHLVPLADISQRFCIGDNFSLDLQYRNGVGGDGEELPLIARGHSALAGLTFTNNAENLDVFARGHYEHINGLGDNWIAGAGVHYYPLKNSQDLRIHALASWNSYDNFITAAVGLSYNFNFKVGKCRGKKQ